jgi:hypothetical protein
LLTQLVCPHLRLVVLLSYVVYLALQAILAPDKSVYIEPLQYAWQFLIDKEADLTIELLFNMLAKPHPRAKPGDYLVLN